MTVRVVTHISKPLYDLIIEEKKKLIKVEKSKVRSRKIQITMVIACQSLIKRIR